MPLKKRVLAFTGSLKKSSINATIIRHIGQQSGGRFEVEIFEQLAALPHFSPDAEVDPLPDAVIALRAAIERADGVLFSSPEYVFSLPSVLKNAIEWTVSTTLFSHKPVALIVAAGSGEKAMASLQLILSTLYAEVREETSLLFKGAKRLRGPQGELTDPTAIAQIELLIELFAEHLRCERAEVTLPDR